MHVCRTVMCCIVAGLRWRPSPNSNCLLLRRVPLHQERLSLWRSLTFPYGSEMSWDNTGEWGCDVQLVTSSPKHSWLSHVPAYATH